MRRMSDRVRHVIGCMTGTSLDGLDAALVEITGTGLEMRARFVDMVSLPLGDLAATLRSFAEGHAHPPIDFMRAARLLGELHAEAVVELLNRAWRSSRTTIDFVVAHGQTIWHAPRERGGASKGGISWQLFDPWPIVRRCEIPVCYDLRQADLIAGGEGAPITPIADWVMYRHDEQTRVVTNLGGICNMTIIPPRAGPHEVTASDVGPCNLLIDGVVRQLYPGLTYDRDGEIASRGGISDEFARLVREASFFRRGWPRSTGREDFNTAWIVSLIDQILEFFPGWEPENIVCSAVYAVAEVIHYEGVSGVSDPTLVLAGGGARNPVLVQHIRALAGSDPVLLSSDLGIPIDAREAMAFAVLGALSQDGVPITLPRVTGATDPGRAGAWVYP